MYELADSFEIVRLLNKSWRTVLDVRVDCHFSVLDIMTLYNKTNFTYNMLLYFKCHTKSTTIVEMEIIRFLKDENFFQFLWELEYFVTICYYELYAF